MSDDAANAFKARTADAEEMAKMTEDATRFLGEIEAMLAAIYGADELSTWEPAEKTALLISTAVIGIMNVNRDTNPLPARVMGLGIAAGQTFAQMPPIHRIALAAGLQEGLGRGMQMVPTVLQPEGTC